MFISRLRAAAKTALTRFGKNEDGALIIFALFLFFLMVTMGGVAVDYMRYEQRRTALQNTLDRGVLAAAAMNQQLDPESVVRDYFNKAGITGNIDAIRVTDSLNGRSVTATGTTDADPIFLHLVGIDSLDANGAAGAEQRVNNVEIALVLDVSGSMSGAKIAALRAAASEFVQTVLESDTQRRISIAVVPYNAQVNLGATLAGQYTLTNVHGVAGANCVEPPTSSFAAPGLSPTSPLPMAAFADVVNGTNQTTSFVSPSDANFGKMVNTSPFCRKNPENVVRLPSNDVATLQAQINALTAGGNTSITLGMKWGLAMLDPGSRGVFSNLIGAGAMNAAFAGRPFDYADSDSMKVVVLMTDGEHVAHTRINDNYKTGNSPIWRSTGDGNYSIRHTTGRPAAAGANQFWVPHLCVSNDCRSGLNTAEAWRAAAWNSGAGTTQQTWQAVWANERLSWVAWQLYARALGTNATRSAQYNAAWNLLSSNYASVGDMNNSLQASCTQAKDRGVLVYGIAFEAPAGGITQIRNCAISDSYFFNASTTGGLDIQTAFRTIATNITQLRLTQ